MSSLTLELQQVTWQASIGSKYLLEDISFKVNQSDRLGIIGAVGSGKTSLLRLLNRLSSATIGKIYFEQEDITRIPVFKLRSQIVLVPQEPKLLGMTVNEALAYPLILQNQPLEIITQRVNYWRNQLHISETWLERNELQLSLGQRQLVAIARALVMEPKILLLDEPTSALDFGIAQNLINILISQSQQHNMTILMVNHQLNLVQDFAERVIWLNEGKLYQDTLTNQLNWLHLKEKLAEVPTETPEDW